MTKILKIVLPLGFLTPSFLSSIGGALSSFASSGIGKFIGNIAPGLLNAGAGIYGANQSKQAVKEAAEVSRQSAREQMEFQTRSNAKQMAFQERMSNTAHQRQIRDLERAGLNPILSAKYGGSSVPSGSSSSGAGYIQGVPDLSGITNSARNYLQAQNLVAQTQNLGEQNTVLGTQSTRATIENEILHRHPEIAVAGMLKDVSLPTLGAIKAYLSLTDDERNSAKTFPAKSGTYKPSKYGVTPQGYTRTKSGALKKKVNKHPYDYPGSRLRQQRERREKLKYYFPSQY